MKGLIHIYTGEGKGKSTAAAGLCLRSLGHDRACAWIYFHKDPQKYGYTEISMLKKNGAHTAGFAKRHPLCNPGVSMETVKEDVKNGIAYIKKLFSENKFDLMVCDELIISVRDKFIEENEVLDLIALKPEKLELVLTGRGATPALYEKADLISYIEKRKHPYDQGIKARCGIEF